MTPQEITGLSNATDAMHAIYTDSEAMHLWLSAPATLRGKLIRASRCARTVRDPRYRFGLTSVPQDVEAIVEAFLAECHVRAEPVRRSLRFHRARSYTWTECWNRLSEALTALGFSYGDSVLLGIE